MLLLHWKQEDWSGREFAITKAEQLLGKIKFDGWASYDAHYTSGTATIAFKTKGIFDYNIDINYNGENVGVAKTSILGKTTIELKTGEMYTLKSEAFTYNRKMLNEAGTEVISYQQPALTFRKGDIMVTEELTELSREVLVSTSLYLKAVSEHQAAILIIIFIPLFMRNIVG
ncbi:hypothetical protein WG947_03855 [Pontibacter sp. H259]|uniref:hypothetical protein n=1 Tax=Pontibacter sp. H259 TaxID=3133421 RepID=UPI0030C1376F